MASRLTPQALAVGVGAGVVAAIVAGNYLRREKIAHRRMLDQIPGAKSGIEPQTINGRTVL